MSPAAAETKLPPPPAARLILTRWGTLAYRDGSGQLRHGSMAAVPRNLFITPPCHLTSPGHPAEAIDLVEIPGTRLSCIRRNGRFVSAEADGQLTCTRARTTGWEQFLLITADELDLYLELQSHDWSLRDARLIHAAEIKFLVDFKFKFGPHLINLATADGVTVTERNRRHIAEISALHDGWKIISARRFAPLLYFAVFGKDHIFEMLKLCLDSIHRHGDYAGHICILSDRQPEQMAAYIPQALSARTILTFRHVTDHASMMMERFDLSDLPIEDFQPLLCLDADMICDAPLTPMLALCNTAVKFFGSSEYHGAPLASINPATRDWFGQFLFDAVGRPTADIYCLNGGAIGFPTRDFARPRFGQITAAFQSSQRHFTAYKRMGEQPILNFILQSQQLIDACALNKFIRFRYQHFNSSDPATGLVHFNYGPGADKMAHMRDYLAALEAESSRSK
jgi:hypothetical protein